MRLIESGSVLRLEDENPGVNYIRQFENGMFATIYETKGGTISETCMGLSEEKVRTQLERDSASGRTMPQHRTPWSRERQFNERRLPERTVWKFVFDISHAPYYSRQLENGMYIGVYAPVENVPGDNDVPFSVDPDHVERYHVSEYVDISEMPIENTPWAEGTYL